MNFVGNKKAECPFSPNRSPAQRVRFGKEEQRRECALTYKISRSKRYKACSDVVRVTGFEPAASCSQSRRATNCATPGYVLFSAAACVCTHFKRNGAFCRTRFPRSRSAAACAFRLHRRQACTFCNLRKIKFNTFFRNSQRFSALQFRVGCGMLYK